jgi:hypothetical protein
VEALERRGVLVSKLEDALGRGEVLEPVLAEVCELRLDERGGRRGEPRRRDEATRGAGQALSSS